MHFVPESNTDPEVAVAALTEIQKLAAKRRAEAEALLAEACAVERLAADAATAHAAERDAAEQAQRARENLEAITATRQAEIARYGELHAAENAAKAEFERAKESFRIANQRLEDATAARLAHPVPSTEPWSQESEARAGLEAAVQTFEQCRDARGRADAELADVQVRLELISGATGLVPDALKRVVERRMADTLRNGTKAKPA